MCGDAIVYTPARESVALWLEAASKVCKGVLQFQYKVRRAFMPKTRDRLFQLFWRLQRPLTIGVRGMVVNNDGKVLIVRHTYTPGWHFPGGGVEKAETASEALARELREEAGVIITGGADLVSVHSNHAVFPNDHILLFRINEWRGEAFTPSREIAEIAFIDPEAPPDGVTGGTLRRLSETFGSAHPSPYW